VTRNLLKKDWTKLDSADLRLLLEVRIGGPGQYSGEKGDANRLYLPLADDSCRVVLRFRGNRISAVEPGLSFDAVQWAQICAEIDTTILVGPRKIGRDISFSGFRVTGWWRGSRSGVQILPPPANAPVVPVEMGEHPFILEFPLQVTQVPSITSYRRRREHRKLTLLLNVLLVGRVNLQPRQTEHVWVAGPWDGDQTRSQWLQQWYFADFGEAVADNLTVSTDSLLEEVEATAYYEQLGYDGRGLRVPVDLDESICRYLDLAPEFREKFDRALFWMDLASRQWTTSMSSSFASLVSAVESLTTRGTIHKVYCKECGKYRDHDVPGPTEQFRDFFETHAFALSLKKRRNDMYALRSGISHGATLMSFDEDLAFGWDPPGWNQRELHGDLWSLTRISMRNWLKNPTAGQGGLDDAGDGRTLCALAGAIQGVRRQFREMFAKLRVSRRAPPLCDHCCHL